MDLSGNTRPKQIFMINGDQFEVIKMFANVRKDKDLK